MRCRVPNCGSEEHFARDCPLRAQSGQQASGSGVFQASGGGLVVQSHYALEGPLTGSIIATPEALSTHENLVQILQNKVGRMIFNALPTGVEICSLRFFSSGDC